MDIDKRLQAEQACASLFNRFAVCNDAGELEDMVNVFTIDALFARPTDPDNYTEGRDSILAAFKARPKDRVTRHLITNIVVDVEDAGSATGKCYATLFTASPDNEAEKFGLQANASQFIGEFDADFRHTEEGWKISRLSGKIVFTT